MSCLLFVRSDKDLVNWLFYGMSTLVDYLLQNPVHINMYIYIYIYIYREREVVDFDKSDKMKILRGKLEKPKTDNGFSHDISSLF